MEKLLAAVAQTHGFDDEAPVQPAARMESPGGGSKWPAGLQPIVIVHNPPPEAARKGRKRKRRRATVVKPSANRIPPPPPPSPPPPRPQKRTKQEVEEEEDVCFICLDGGSLVLCDRKGCPKAYHPVCIKRDEAFFRLKAKWTCGWHICSVCQKGSYYMCYTCTYSLCKGCIEDSDFSCVRGDKGFCSTCMNVIMLIENEGQASNELVQVDFDDKTSWEYLLKVYWVILKDKISLTMSELIKSRKTPKSTFQSSSLHCSMINGNPSNSTTSAEHLKLKKSVDVGTQQNDGSRSKRAKRSSREKDGEKVSVIPNTGKVINRPMSVKADDKPGTKEATDRPITEGDREKASADKPCICRTTDDKKPLDKAGIDVWATKELLEFVAHMRNGNVLPMSQFDVQMLVLDYVKRNNLRNPRQKSRIICDERLKNLFGKPCVGHIEMLKLLESHFLGKDDSQSCFISAGFVADSSMEVDGNMHDVPKQAKVRKRMGRKQKEKRPAQNHINDYAAIDVHNINLIYLRFNLMENLLKDPDSFNDKVVGSMVRIRIFSDDGKQELYRLVRVVGTIKTIEPYKIGDRTSDIMLEILNLNKKEVVQICAISNQEFTEDECIRLRQSIKYGLMKPFTVGEVQKKAVELQPVRINDWMEVEISQLNRLQDQASENGNENEVREYMDKLEILQSPEERQRRIAQVPEIHSDPRVSPYYESEEDLKNRVNSRKGSTSVATKSRRGENMRPSNTGRRQKGRKSASPNKEVVGSNGERRTTRSQGRVMESADGWDNSDKQMNQVSNNALGGSVGVDHAVQSTGLETLVATDSAAESPSANHIETENLWHYRDPSGKIQGPFSMMLLRKWNTSGLFPTEMRIWTNHEQYDSVLLTDALNGHFHGTSEVSCQLCLVSSQENGTGIGVSEVKDVEAAPSNHVNVLSENNNRGAAREDVSSSSWWPSCWNSIEDTNVDSEDVQARSEVPPPLSSCGKTDVDSALDLPSAGRNLETASKSVDSDKQGGNVDVLDLLSTGPNFVAASKSPESGKQTGGGGDIDVFDLLSMSISPKTVQPLPSGMPIHDSGISEFLYLTPKLNNEDHGIETKQSAGPDSGRSWSNASTCAQLSDVAGIWNSDPPPRPPEGSSENVGTLIGDGFKLSHASSPSAASNWISILDEPINAYGVDSISDLLAEVDAMESQKESLPSPRSVMKYARELIEDCKDECFSSIEDFSSSSTKPSLSSSGLLTSSSKPIQTFDSSVKRSSVNSSGSSEGETNAYDTGLVNQNNGAESGRGLVQGNINLVTVQGNVNLVLGGGGGGGSEGMGSSVGWGSTNSAAACAWMEHNNKSSCSSSAMWDCSQRRNERGRGRQSVSVAYPPPPPRGNPKGQQQRVCKFYESGHCKKGAYCDYLHHP